MAQRHVTAESRPTSLQNDRSTYQPVDIAALVEEVIDDLVAEQNHNHAISSRTPPAVSITPTNRVGLFDNDHVELILDITARHWTYYTEPRILRRMVMNLVGNALKFTQPGFVHVKVEFATAKRPTKLPYLLMAVSDTGQGISRSYLKDTLFSPFSQETTLSVGTGLGLTLVKSIIRTMSGSISIQSSPEAGTKATVKIPLGGEVLIPRDENQDTRLLDMDQASQHERRTLIDAIRLRVRQRTGALHWHEGQDTLDAHYKALQLLQASLVAYLSRWFGLSVAPWQEGCTYDVVISTVNGLRHLEQLEPEMFEASSRSVIMAIKTTNSPVSAAAGDMHTSRIVTICCPFGPFKLAKAMRACLDKLDSACCLTEDGMKNS